MAATAPPAVDLAAASEQAAASSMEAIASAAPQAVQEPQVVPEPAYVPSARSRQPAAAPKAEKSGLPVGVIAGAAVAAVTLLAAGLGLAKSGSKGDKKAAPKPPASAARRPASSAGAKASSGGGARGSSSGGAARTTTSRTSSTAGRRSSTSGSSASGSRPSSRTGAGGSAATRKPAAARSKPAAAAPVEAAAAVAAAAAAPAKPAAAAPAKPAAAAEPTPAPPAVVEQAAKKAPEPATPPATTPAAAAATPPPALPAAAAAAEPKAAAPAPAPVAEPAAPVTPAADQATPAAAAPAVPAPAAAAEEPTTAPAAASAAEEPAATTAAAAVEEEAAPAAAEEPAAASTEEAADAPAAPAAAAAAETTAAAADTTAAAAAAEGGEAAAEAAEGEDGDLIELAEGETLPVVDEAGNTLGTLHHDGRVLDAEGNVIGGLDEEGNVMLYEQQPAADEMIILSPAEEEAEQLMRQAAMAWNMHHNRDAAEKFQRKALDAVTREEGAARPEIVAEVASSLADMLYATNKMAEAKDALQVALDAAERSEQHALYIKLSNNMGAVLRKQELHSESKALHQKAMQMALDKFGVAHATTTLARGNLVDALDQLGEREEARALLNESVATIKEYAAKKEADEAAGGADKAAANGTADGGDAAAEPATNGLPDVEGADAAAAAKQSSAEMAAMLAVDSKRAATAAIRAQIELARLEMKEKDFPRAVEVLEGALAMATDKFGADTAEASSVMAALATCHRQSGDLDTSARLFCQLYEINEAQSEGGAANQSGVMLARTLADLYQEAEKDSDALKWAETALDLMQQVSELPRTHPALEPHIQLVIELRQKTGDESGAEDLRKELLKNKAKLMAAVQRQQGAAGGRGAGGRGGAAAAAAAAAAGGRANGAAGRGAGGKKGGGRKQK